MLPLEGFDQFEPSPCWAVLLTSDNIADVAERLGSIGCQDVLVGYGSFGPTALTVTLTNTVVVHPGSYLVAEHGGNLRVVPKLTVERFWRKLSEAEVAELEALANQEPSDG